ncbi:MAG TPA: hypothetical protein VGW40_15565 [Allosphingosinicella sp.]|nr:hypothetical protein [Allosphingosinicella sp.]
MTLIERGGPGKAAAAQTVRIRTETVRHRTLSRAQAIGAEAAKARKPVAKKPNAKARASNFAIFILPERGKPLMPGEEHEPCQVPKAAEIRDFPSPGLRPAPPPRVRARTLARSLIVRYRTSREALQ